MPDIASLIEAQAMIVDTLQRRFTNTAEPSGNAVVYTSKDALSETTKALAVAIDKYATLKMVEREQPQKPSPPPPPMRLDP